MAEFHAHPMPLFDNGPKGLPSKKPPSGTKVEPFDLQIDKRAENKKQVFEKEVNKLDLHDGLGSGSWIWRKCQTYYMGRLFPVRLLYFSTSSWLYFYLVHHVYLFCFGKVALTYLLILITMHRLYFFLCFFHLCLF